MSMRATELQAAQVASRAKELRRQRNAAERKRRNAMERAQAHLGPQVAAERGPSA